MSNENIEQSLDMARAAGIAKQLLRSYQISGLQTLPKPQERHDFGFAIEAEGQPTEQAPRSTQPTTIGQAPKSAPNVVSQDPPDAGPGNELDRWSSEPLPASERASSLEILAAEVQQCTRCSDLAACRNNTVFGVGNPKPQLCFLGEGPGADEDRQGEPFVGAAGQLLNRIIEACKMKREDVYILNTVKCRPPGNRNPSDQELANCWPYAIRQLEILQPDFICCLGSVAARTLLQTKQSIGRMRGQFYRFRGSQVVVTYHPAYLLRNPNAKRQVWDDMKILLAAMGRSI